MKYWKKPKNRVIGKREIAFTEVSGGLMQLPEHHNGDDEPD